MSIPNAITKIRLKYHLNAIDAYNSLNQLHLVSDDRAENANKEHFKQCVDCFMRLGFKIPEEFIAFAKD